MIRTKLAALAGAVVIAAVAAACSSGPTTKSGTETITGTESGQAVVTLLNSSANVQPVFPVFTYTGPVNTVAKNFKLPGGDAKTETDTLLTPAGNLTLTHTRTYQAGQTTKPTLTGKSGSVCIFSFTAESGTFVAVPSKSTGQFAGATGHGTYKITINMGAALPAGKTTCNVKDFGPHGPTPIAQQGTSFVFRATGPLTVKS
jgi:hypothetical protein